MMNDKTYDIVKWISTIVLPAIGTLYFALASIWGFPYAEQIVGTITALVTFLGVVLKISSSKYEGNGIMAINQNDETGLSEYTFALGTPLSDIQGKKLVTFKVAETKESASN